MAKSDSSAMSCPVCGEAVPAEQIEPHLRRKHQIFQFRGERRSANDTVSYLLGLSFRSPPDREAWNTLVAIVREQQGNRADSFLAASLLASLARVEPAQREQARSSVINTIAGSEAPGLIAALLSYPDPQARPFALMLASRWSAPLPPALIPVLTPILSDRKLPEGLALPIAACLVRALPPESDARERVVLEALVAGLGKVAAAQRLYRLQDLTGPRPQLKACRDRLEGQVRMQCPRCELELRRAEMIDHLWSEHRLVLDGQKVREPWALLQDWLEQANGAISRELRERCQSLAQQADPDRGMVRLNRLILQGCPEDSEAARGLLSVAKEQRASVCPSCYALIPVPKPEPGHPLNSWRGRLSGRGYRIEIRERGLLTRLEMESPEGPLVQRTEPGHRLSARGRQWLFTGPFVFLALGLAAGLIPLPFEVDPLLPVGGALLLATLVGAVIATRGKPSQPIPDRVVDHAWRLMLPQLAERGYVSTDADFLAGLALVSANRGKPEVRRPFLDRALKFAASEAVKGRSVGPLAALRRLAVHDAVADGKDPIPMVVEELTHCLTGRLPLAYGEALLTDWESSWWTTANLARLKVLLCDRGFEEGFEVSDLVEIGQSYPALGSVLGVQSPRGLAWLRLLWSMRASRPWDRNSPAQTVFELAPYRSSVPLFQLFPDLLLLHENDQYRAGPAARKEPLSPMRIAITGKGVALQDTLFERIPKTFESSTRKAAGHFELRVGSELFRFSADPTYVADRLERFMRFLFNDFLPQVPPVLEWKSPDVGAKLRARGATPCPECRKPVLPRIGTVARSVKDSGRQPAQE